VKDDEALEVAASLKDYIVDLIDGWDDCNASDQLQAARYCIDSCGRLEELGYLCHMGHHKQKLREKNRPDLVFDVGLFSIRDKSGADGTRYALIELEGRWETVNEDGAPLAASSFK
jgi:hypothetical protein